MRESEINHVRARVRRSWYADGLYDLLTGVALIALGGLWLMPPAMRWVTLPLVLAVMAFLVAQRRLLLWLKERITFPRAGHAVPKQSTWLRRLTASAVLVSPMLAGYALEGVLRTAGWIAPYATSFMIVLAAICVAVGVWYWQYSVLVTGVIGFGLSFGLPLIGLKGNIVFAVYTFILGVCFLVFGAGKLRRFLRKVGSGPSSSEVG